MRTRKKFKTFALRVGMFILIGATCFLLGYETSDRRAQKLAAKLNYRIARKQEIIENYESKNRSWQECMFFIYKDGNDSKEGKAEARLMLPPPPPLSKDLPPPPPPPPRAVPTLAPEIISTLKNISGTHTANGFDPKNLAPLGFNILSFQLLPHLLRDHKSIRPSFHMGGGRTNAEIVIGVTSVKRDKENYLTITLTGLVEGLSAKDERSVLIVVFLGDPDPAFIIQTALQIERFFSKQLESGLLEVIAPSAAYYPDLDKMQPTLGDSVKRFKWRTKQNLDNIFLMTFCQPRAPYYLMVEDDVITKKNYFSEIMNFIDVSTDSKPEWVVLEFCRVGAIGKLLRSSQLVSFITYIELFHTKMPIDWLIEDYLEHMVCNREKNDKDCATAKMTIRPRFNQSLFQHIGLYSSLSGKIQKLKDNHFGSIPLFTPHQNPPLSDLKSTIQEYSGKTIAKAYNGDSYFWGLTPKKGDNIEFKFKTPITIERFKFTSGSLEHVSDIFYSTTVEVMPANVHSKFIIIGQFNELGVAEGVVDIALGRISSLRLHVQQNSEYWVILNEILIKEQQQPI